MRKLEKVEEFEKRGMKDTEGKRFAIIVAVFFSLLLALGITNTAIAACEENEKKTEEIEIESMAEPAVSAHLEVF